MEQPIIAMTMGDPAGIGPELVAKVVSHPAVRSLCRPVVIGDVALVRDAMALVGSGLEVRDVRSLGETRFPRDGVEVLPPDGLPVGRVVPSRVDASTGKAAAVCLQKASELAMAGLVDGVVLAPMQKQAFHLAGYDYVDELEYLAEVTKTPAPFLFGAVHPSLWTVAVTMHVPFRDIAGLITRERVGKHIRRLHEVLEAVGIAGPRIAVAALNVHGGEGGLFGREEVDEIGPAIGDARVLGVDAEGPLPADTVFVRARQGEFQGVVCMYHDQANIARKLLATMTGATLYLGLPVPFATTAHGTALDKAWQGIADPGSMQAALEQVVKLAAHGRGR